MRIPRMLGIEDPNTVNVKNKKNGIWLLTAATAVAVTIAAPILSQTVPDEDNQPGNQLDLPKDLTVFGKSDPNVRKATAIVNGSIITATDVDQRLALVVAANG